ncbi:MAG: LysM peptidoglycan-binding domain-containing protein [Sulfuricella sp.]|jgi:membrane-bound lytic murein transglycosylase D|nr:LysM peptidoglycan-binding domain-containing protein [Sulfuricella sp.]
MRLRAVSFLVLAVLGTFSATAANAQDASPWTADDWNFQRSQPTENQPAPDKKQASPDNAASAPDALPESAMQTSAKQADSSSLDTQASLRPAEQIDSVSTPFGLSGLDNDNTDLWGRIRAGFALSDLDSPLVKEHEDWYSARPEYVGRMMERSQRYLFYIVEEVEKRGMPTEIALLPMIESAYNPKAYSTSHAAGIWQFIPSTGKNFGLNQNLLYDGRRDVIAATDAALDYLQKLYNMFGSWELALAAYNWGEGSVSRAIARNQARGEPADYLSLHMPPETRNYVPKLIAVKNIISNPAAYGLTLNSIPNSPYFATVKLKQHMDVALAARLAEVPLDEFVALNPAYNKPLVAGTGTGKPTLLLPVDKANNFSLNLENYDRPLSSWQTYTPRHGEKLAAIARHFGISLARLKELNAIGGHKKLAAAQTLLVPIARSGSTPSLAAHIPDAEPAREYALTGSKTTHIVAKGDTVPGIAKRFGITVAQLKTQNHLKSNRLTQGQKLTVLAAAKPEKASHSDARQGREAPVKGKRVTLAKTSGAAKHSSYVVKRGDTVYSIARRFNVAVNDLQRWNKLPTNYNLQPGNKLKNTPDN